MKRLLALALLLAGCGGKSGTISLQVVVSPGDDPFADAAQVRFTVGDAMHVTTVPVQMGHFDFKVSNKPTNMTGPIIVEALDAQGAVVARGQTPVLLLEAMDQGPISVWVGRVGKFQPAAAALPKAVADVSAAMVPGLGVLFAGGHDATGSTLSDTEVYDIYTHTVISTSPLTKAVAGGAAAPVSGVKAVLWGGATAAGVHATGAPDATFSLFDPTVGTGVWSPLQSDMLTPRSYANVTALSSGDLLITGGADDAGNPVGTAGLVNPDGAVRLAAIPSPMVAPRLGHAVAPAKFPDGDGAILFGGLAPGATGPVAERLVGQAFTAYDVGAQDNRVNATATLMPSGDVLVLGGKTAAGAQASGLVISPTAPSATVTPLPNALSVAREGHTASLTGNELLVCGGADASGALQASCDVLDAMTYALVRTIPLSVGRRDHVAAVLETGTVLLAAGTGADGAPLGSIELYTPSP